MKTEKPEICSVTCDYCGNLATLVDGSVIYPHLKHLAEQRFWYCEADQAWVGVHKNSPRYAPLGRLANEELRGWRQWTHEVFDPLWRDGHMSRTAAYRLMQDLLGLDRKQAHIGELDVDQCKVLVQGVEEYKKGLSAT